MYQLNYKNKPSFILYLRVVTFPNPELFLPPQDRCHSKFIRIMSKFIPTFPSPSMLPPGDIVAELGMGPDIGTGP
jgi:hypothetical protein